MRGLADLARFRKQHPEHTLLVDGARWGVIDTAPKARPHSRPTLLLLPGTMGTADIFWLQMRAMGRAVRTIALTYPAVADIERYAEGACRILAKKGLRSAAVLGTSLGGYVAQTIALRHPQCVERLFIANSLCNPHAPWRSERPSLEEMEAMDARELKARRTERIADWPESDAGLALAKQVVTEQGKERISARHLKARVIALMRAGDLPKLPVPDERIVVIDCEDDPVMPPPGRKDVRSRYPGAARYTLPSGGHFPYVSRADAYAEILRRHVLS